MASKRNEMAMGGGDGHGRKHGTVETKRKSGEEQTTAGGIRTRSIVAGVSKVEKEEETRNFRRGDIVWATLKKMRPFPAIVRSVVQDNVLVAFLPKKDGFGAALSDQVHKVSKNNVRYFMKEDKLPSHASPEMQIAFNAAMDELQKPKKRPPSPISYKQLMMTGAYSTKPNDVDTGKFKLMSSTPTAVVSSKSRAVPAIPQNSPTVHPKLLRRSNGSSTRTSESHASPECAVTNLESKSPSNGDLSMSPNNQYEDGEVVWVGSEPDEDPLPAKIARITDEHIFVRYFPIANDSVALKFEKRHVSKMSRPMLLAAISLAKTPEINFKLTCAEQCLDSLEGKDEKIPFVETNSVSGVSEQPSTDSDNDTLLLPSPDEGIIADGESAEPPIEPITAAVATKETVAPVALVIEADEPEQKPEDANETLPTIEEPAATSGSVATPENLKVPAKVEMVSPKAKRGRKRKVTDPADQDSPVPTHKRVKVESESMNASSGQDNSMDSTPATPADEPLRKGDVAMVKYKNSPSWPALITNRDEKKKSCVYVWLPLDKDTLIGKRRFHARDRDVRRFGSMEDDLNRDIKQIKPPDLRAAMESARLINQGIIKPFDEIVPRFESALSMTKSPLPKRKTATPTMTKTMVPAEKKKVIESPLPKTPITTMLHVDKKKVTKVSNATSASTSSSASDRFSNMEKKVAEYLPSKLTTQRVAKVETPSSSTSNQKSNLIREAFMSRECEKAVQKIGRGVVESDRHKQYLERPGWKDGVKVFSVAFANLIPVAALELMGHNEKQQMEAVETVFAAIDPNDHPSLFQRLAYCLQVAIPRALAWSLAKIRKCGLAEANTLVNQMYSSIATVPVTVHNGDESGETRGNNACPTLDILAQVACEEREQL